MRGRVELVLVDVGGAVEEKAAEAGFGGGESD